MHAKSLRVLVVDDDPAARLLCSVNLEQEGLQVIEAADGRRALVRALIDQPDLVLTDVMMPGFSGFELAEALRRDQRTRSIPIIFVSGETSPNNQSRAQELGALAFVTKPFDPRTLAAVVDRALSQEREAVVNDIHSRRIRPKHQPS